jgi:hypothetical protein
VSVDFTKSAVRFKKLDFLVGSGYRVGTDGSMWSRRIVKKKKGTRGGFIAMVGGPWKRMNTPPNNNGYETVDMSIFGVKNSKKTYQVHRLVLLTFVGPCPEGMQCRHLDGNQRNNRLSNLKWGTIKENSRDRIRHGTDARGEKNANAKLTKLDVDEILRMHQTGDWKGTELAKMYNVTPGMIGHIVNKRNWVK